MNQFSPVDAYPLTAAKLAAVPFPCRTRQERGERKEDGGQRKVGPQLGGDAAPQWGTRTNQRAIHAALTQRVRVRHGVFLARFPCRKDGKAAGLAVALLHWCAGGDRRLTEDQ